MMYSIRAAVLPLAVLLAAGGLPAQNQPQAPAAPTTPSAPSTPSTPSIPGGGQGGGRGPTSPTIPSQPTTPQQPTFPEMQRQLMFVSGRVLLEDGSVPADQVIIERMCNGITRPEGYADSKGRFSFQLGQNQSAVVDASFSSSDNFGRSAFGSNGSTAEGVTTQELMGCEIRAKVSGYISDSIPLAGRRFMDNPDIGTITLRKLGNVEGLTVSATGLNAPKKAKEAYEKGHDRLTKKKWDEAEKELRKAIELHPKYAVAWYELGLVLVQQQKIADAKQAFQEAINSDSKFVKPYLPMAEMESKTPNWEGVAKYSDELARLNPYEFPQAFFFSAVAHYNLKNYEKSEASAQQVVKMDTQHRLPRAQQILGILLAMRGDFSGSATQLKGFLEHAAPADPAVEQVKKVLADVEARIAQNAANQVTQPAQ
jgi:tetratricopeptide (TPR) repeat protein